MGDHNVVRSVSFCYEDNDDLMWNKDEWEWAEDAHNQKGPNNKKKIILNCDSVIPGWTTWYGNPPENSIEKMPKKNQGYLWRTR